MHGVLLWRGLVEMEVLFALRVLLVEYCSVASGEAMEEATEAVVWVFVVVELAVVEEVEYCLLEEAAEEEEGIQEQLEASAQDVHQKKSVAAVD
jgi:hypothetical protein